MNAIKKKILGALFVLHFVLILLSLLPKSPLIDSTQGVVQSYVSPIFRQNWHMFAPLPLTFSARLIVKCEKDSQWLDPTADLIQSHNQLPFIHHQKAVFLYNSLSQTLLDFRTSFIEESQCLKKSVKSCEENFKVYISTTDAYSKAKEVGKQACRNSNWKGLVGIYIEHAKSFSETYQIPNKGNEILELN